MYSKSSTTRYYLLWNFRSQFMFSIPIRKVSLRGLSLQAARISEMGLSQSVCNDFALVLTIFVLGLFVSRVDARWWWALSWSNR